ncbi:MAG: beta strand repeat-containing protein [Methylophilaceae bacterium]
MDNSTTDLMMRVKPIVLSVAFAVAIQLAQHAQAQDVLPTAPQVVGGAATVTQTATQQTITQTTDKAIINWGSFSIGANNSVQFIQPESSSVILNRVIGSDPSSIFGSMSANGQVFLVNPNGVFFAIGSSIDTAGLVATTMSISNSDFMSGYFNFERSGGGQVENAGIITIRDGGFALLAADKVINTADGRIIATNGNVALASADRVTIETKSDGLVGFSVEGTALREVATIENAGFISADGGKILMSARGARELTGMVVNNTGVLRAQGIEEKDGAIVLSGSSGYTRSSGTIDVSGKRGGNIQVTNEQGEAIVSGNLTARGDSGAGGNILVAGNQTGVFSDTVLDVSGTSGGNVRIGGDFKGGALVDGIVSDQTYVAKTANILANGTAGDGGSVVVWADGTTRYDGNISATGSGAGVGGNAEVSGKQNLAFNGSANLTSASGKSGTLLLDPTNITITDQDSIPGAADDAELNDDELLAGDPAASGTNSFISRGKLESLSGSADVVLEATEKITLNDLAGNQLNMAQNGSGSLTLRTTTSSASGGIEFVDKNDLIITQGGDVTISAGGSGKIDIGGIASSGGDITLVTNTGNLDTRSLSSSNGNVSLTTGGTGAISTNGSAISAGNGTVTVTANNANINTAAITAKGITLKNLVGGNITSTGTLNAGSDTLTMTTADGNIQTTGLSGSNVNLTANGTNKTINTSGAVSSSGNVTFAATGNITTSGSVTGTNGVSYNSSGGALNTADVNSNGIIGFTGLSMLLGNATTSGNINIAGVTSGNTVYQKSGTRVKANTLTANLAGTGGNVDMRLNNEVNNFSGTGSSYVGFKSVNNLSVGTVTTNNAAGNSVDISSNGKLTVAGAVTATADATHGAQITLAGGNGIDVANNITATGGGGLTSGGTSGVDAAKVTLSASGGSINQTAGQIKAYDLGAKQVDATKYTHAATIAMNADNGSVTVKNLLAQSDGGRGQVNLAAKNGITVASGGSIESIAASQPGVSLNAQLNSGSGDVTTTGAVIKTTQTAEIVSSDGNGNNSYKDINKPVQDAGGIGINGRNLNLGALSTDFTPATVHTALYGISTTSTENITFNGLVSTSSSIAATTTGNGTIKTTGNGLLRAKVLSLTADRDKGLFAVKTDISALTVLGGKGVDIDNTTVTNGANGTDIYNTGTLRVDALGNISEASTNPQTGQAIPATNKPVGGVRIKSNAINLVSMDNRSTNTYLYDGTGTSDQQDLVLIANKIEYLPGAIQTGDKTVINLMPLTAGRAISVVYALPTVLDSNITYYSAGDGGLLDQFNPKSKIYIGDGFVLGNSGSRYGYSGNINIASAGDATSGLQMSLGNMELHFETSGRVYNNYAVNTDTPSGWTITGNAPFTVTEPCTTAQTCLSNMTTGKIYIKDAYKQFSQTNDTRNVVIQGHGDGTGGHTPPATTAGNSQTPGGSGGSGGSSSGGNPSDNDSQPGGSNAPSTQPNGGGNDNTPPTSTGTTEITTNPGNTPVPATTTNPTDPTTPPNTTSPPGTLTNNPAPTDGSGVLDGGGDFSSGPTGGGTLSDGTTPTTTTPATTPPVTPPVTPPPTSTPPFTGGGNPGSGLDPVGTPPVPVGGGTFSDGSTPVTTPLTTTPVTTAPVTTPVTTPPTTTPIGGGFTGGGNPGNGVDPVGTTPSPSGGGTFSDGSTTPSVTPSATTPNGTTPSGTPVTDSSGTPVNNGGFAGGANPVNNSANPVSTTTAGGGTFSDGSTTTTTSSTSSTATTGSTTNTGSNNTNSTSTTANANGTNTATTSPPVNNGGFSGGAGTTDNSGNPSSSSSGGATFSDGSTTSGSGTSSTSTAGGSVNNGSSGTSATGSSSNSGNAAPATTTAGGSDFSGSTNGASGSGTSVGNNYGGFSGGASSGGDSYWQPSGGSSGGGAFSDGSTGGSSSTGAQLSGGNVTNTATGSSNTNGGSTSSQSSSGNQGGSGQAAINDASDGDSLFSGGAEGGGVGDGTVKEGTAEEANVLPECPDESQSVKKVVRAGQPNNEMIQMKATGVRLRPSVGTVNQQRAACATAGAKN